MGHGHAVVIGGSIAGLATARALSDTFDRITIVERDVLPDGPEHRDGVPQARQLHVLLPLGAQILDEFFPGFVDELHEEGCTTFDEVLDTPWFGPQGWRARTETDVKLIGFRRSVLEHVLRRRVRGLDEVEIAVGTVTGITATEDGARVTGVKLVGPDGAQTTLEADLVVDASGRGTNSPKWLEELGYERPAEEHVRAYFGYASRFVKLKEGAELPFGLRGVITMPFPGHSRGGCFLPSDNGLYTLCAIGSTKDFPPGDEDAFYEYIAGAPSPLLKQMADLSEPVTEINTYQHPGNQRRFWEDMPRRPIGFIPIGDAIGSFNPVYGQGMTTASVEARALRERLATLENLDELPDLWAQDVRPLLEFPYSMAIGQDSQYDGVTYVNAEPPPPEQAEFFRLMEQVATEDPHVARDILHAVGWYQPELLASEELQAKVQAWAGSGQAVTNNDPTLVREPVDQPA